MPPLPEQSGGLTRAERQAAAFAARATELAPREWWTWRRLAPCGCGLLCLAKTLDANGRCAQCVHDRYRVAMAANARARAAELAKVPTLFEAA